LVACSFPKSRMVARVLEDKLNEEFELELSLLIKLLSLKPFQLLEVEGD